MFTEVFAFLRGGMGPSHSIPCACLCAGHIGNYSTAVFNRGKHLFSYFNIQKLFVGIVDDIDSLFVRESSVRILLNIFYPLTRRMPLLKITGAFMSMISKIYTTTTKGYYLPKVETFDLI